MIPKDSRLADKVEKSKVVNKQRILSPWLRSAISGLAATRIMRRMKTVGVLDEGGLPMSHPHRLVGIHNEDSFIYSDMGVSTSTGQPGVSASESYALMAVPVDTTAAASLDTLEAVSDASSDIDYGGHISPVVTADAVSALSPTTSSLGAKHTSALSPLTKVTKAFGAVSLKADLSEFALPPASIPRGRVRRPMWSEEPSDDE